jgi:hypothetical protein
MNMRGVDARNASNSMSDALGSVIDAARRVCTGHAAGGTSLDRDAILVYESASLVLRSGRSPAGSGPLLYEPASYRVRSSMSSSGTYEPFEFLESAKCLWSMVDKGDGAFEVFLKLREKMIPKKRYRKTIQENEARGTEDGLRFWSM